MFIAKTFVLLIFVAQTHFNKYIEPVSTCDAPIIIKEEAAPPPKEFLEKEIIFTNYYPNDSTNSTHKTGSGLQTKDFEVNINGWYTYKGRVVIASATYECLNSTKGACAKYNELPDGYLMFSYFDEVQFRFEGVVYDAIVLDTIGAGFWEREYQTFDIFVWGKQVSFGRRKAEIIWENK